MDEQTIKQALQAGHDVIANIHLKRLSGHDWAHYVLINELKDGQATITDPAYDRKNHWRAPVEQLIDAMSESHDDKKRGIVIITDTKQAFA